MFGKMFGINKYIEKIIGVFNFEINKMFLKVGYSITFLI